MANSRNRRSISNKPDRYCYDPSSLSQEHTYTPKAVCPAYDSRQDDNATYCVNDPQTSHYDRRNEDIADYYDTTVKSTYDRKGKVTRNIPKTKTKEVCKNNTYDYRYSRELPSGFKRGNDNFNIDVSGEDQYYTGNKSEYSVDEEDIDPALRPRAFDMYGLGSSTSMETITQATDHHRRQNRVCFPAGEMKNDSEAYRVSELKIPITRTDSKTEKNIKGERPCKKPKPKSIMKLFDEAVNYRLKKLTEDTQEKFSMANDPCSALKGGRRSIAIKTSLSTFELARSLHPDYKSGALVDATDKLAQAEAACRYDGAIKAAEAAAAGISESLKAEEAAAAGVRGYQAELTDCIQEEVVGMKPIELLGYVGITKPKS
ncbi:hypothetical protein L9F63_008692 [Diploptera punctata]|uniref:Uncharacterized protein n=1 Tax=Diploptera punctata TaxID=6984 RepID=A0AAD8E2C8_DIPPU|nr:hypothetical protein L9F63_008692 [Diploptera punctata]